MNHQSPIVMLEGLLAAVAALPLGLHLLAGAGFVAGLILWLAGGRVLQPAFVVLGTLVGAGVGGFVMPLVHDGPVFGVPSVYAGISVGVVLGLVLSIVMFKLALAVSSGAVFAGLGIIVAVIMLSRTPGALPEDLPSGQEAASALRASGVELRDRVKADPTDQAGKVREFVDEHRAQIRARWDAMPAQSRMMLMSCAGGGLVLGVLIGLAAPKKSATLVTSLAGSAAVMGFGYWLLHAMNAELAEKVPQSPIVVGGIWAVLTLIGLGVQSQSGGGETKPAPAAPSAE